MSHWENQQRDMRSAPKPKWMRGVILGILMILGLSFVFYASRNQQTVTQSLGGLDLPQAIADEPAHQGQDDQVVSTVGTRDQEGAMNLDEVALHDLLAHEGEKVKLQGVIKEVLLPVGFLLTGQQSNEELVVIYRVGDISGLPPGQGVPVIVEGDLVRLDMEDVADTIGMDAVHKTVFAPYQGQLAIIAKSMSH